MSSRLRPGATPRLLPPSGSVTNNASDSNTQLSMDHDVAPAAREPSSNPGSTDQPVDHTPAMPTGCHFAPFEGDLNDLAQTPRWQKDLDDHFTNVFKRSVLAEHPIDDTVALAFHILGRPTRAKIRGLARTVYVHWTCMQFRSKNTNVCARGIVQLISKITDHLGRMSVHPKMDFLDELNYLCVQKLKLTLRRYVDVVFHEILPMPRKNLFMRVMAVVAMISHLFHGGQLRYSAALNGLRYIASMSPWPDAIAIVYALLHELGPEFALEQAGWRFIQCLLAELSLLTLDRVPADPLCQLVSAINALVAEWYNRTCVTLYHAHPRGGGQSHGHHSQM